jgi:hypothetical protein
LLYSKEFYGLVKRHLRPGGILQQWLPGGEPIVESAVTKALQQSFPDVRVFGSIMNYGTHFLASMTPIPTPAASVLAARIPANAAIDMLEWGPETTPERQFAAVLRNELAPEQLTRQYPSAPAMQDDRPVNEYFYMRHHPAIFGRVLSGADSQ